MAGNTASSSQGPTPSPPASPAPVPMGPPRALKTFPLMQRIPPTQRIPTPQRILPTQRTGTYSFKIALRDAVRQTKATPGRRLSDVFRGPKGRGA